MYYEKGMESRLRKGDVGEAVFREWFERNVVGILGARKISIEQQGFNPGGFEVLSGKGHLKEKNDPDFALCQQGIDKPLVGISINTQAKLYTAESSMGKGCIKCPRAYSCHDGFEGNLWYNEYNLSDYHKFEERFKVDVCMVTLLVNVNSAVDWIEKSGMKPLVHAYIFNGGRDLKGAERAKLDELLTYLRSGRRRNWTRPLQIKWLFRSELEKITYEKTSVRKGNISYWVTGGRVERGRPRPICCVDARFAHDEKQLISFFTSLVE